MAFFFEDLAVILTGMMPAGHQFTGDIDTIESIMFLWAPMVYLIAWFVWAVRYYVSPNTYVSSRRGGI